LTALLSPHSTKLTDRKCDPRRGIDDLRCPEGSTCVKDAEGQGTCCYGLPDPADPSDPRDPNNLRNSVVEDPRCPGENRCGKCPKGQSCKRFELECLEAPCPHTYRCAPAVKVKPGHCPAIPTSTPPPYCQRIVPERLCQTDSQCPDNLKCCRPTCGGRTCMKAILDH
ncbi:antileukoproteinase-like, partial [Aplysia californica]|uniref:Antileukoproteinase-like n=1 Tax=Aplysia californica TaxID=6500 RepID=A0ABM0KB17_APLCA